MAMARVGRDVVWSGGMGSVSMNQIAFPPVLSLLTSDLNWNEC